MRYIYLLLALFLVFQKETFCQTSDIILNSPESGTQTHTAQYSVLFNPGYSYTASGGTLTAEVTNPTYPNYSYESIDPETRSLSQSYAVGSTQGAFSVSPSGNASYTIPFEFPEGRGGLNPSLSLVYSSMSSSGIAGSGWNLSGFSSISRCPQNYYLDGQSMGVNLDANDRFMIDGQRLLATSGNYGAAGTQYRTENDIFTRVTSLGTCGTGPEKFKAETKSGLVYEYGFTSDATQKISGFTEVANWYVSRIYDCYGNQISFSYTNNNGIVYPYQIIYGSNSVTFYYKERADKTDSYFKGVKTTQNLMLDRVEIKYNGNIIKKYVLAYTSLDDTYNGYSLLNEVIEYGSNEKRYNSTAFSYKSPSQVNITQTSYNSTHNYITYSSKLCTGDFNGDGKADFVCLPDPSKGATWTGICVYFSDGNGNFNDYFTKNISIDVSKLQDIRALDINGDGKDDLLYEINDNGSSSFYYTLNPQEKKNRQKSMLSMREFEISFQIYRLFSL